MSDVVALKYTVGDLAGRKLAERSVEALKTLGWTEHVDRRGLRLLTKRSPADVAPIVLQDDGGVVMGIMFERADSGARRLLEVDRATAVEWCSSHGHALVERFWGPYLVALLDLERDRVLILRDPMGARPCYFAELGRVRVMFTDLHAWSALCTLEMDLEYLRLFLAHPRLVLERSGIVGVEEAAPGRLYAWERTRTTQTQLWAPEPPSRKDAQMAFDDASALLRSTAESCGVTWAKAGLPIIHRLSGGMDSGAALACIVKGGATDIVAINERPHEIPEADEFEAAARTAGCLGVPLLEVPCAASAVDYRRLLDAPAAPKPSLADLSFADPSVLFVFDQDRAVLLTSGQGGDQVFSRRPLLDGAADAVRDGRSWPEVLQIIMDGARLSGKSAAFLLAQTWQGLTQSQQRSLGRAMGIEAESRDSMRRKAMECSFEHPWVAGIDHRGPARALRALNLIDLSFYQRPTLLAVRSIAAPIFASQPMVETVLRIPPYLMQRGGSDRALARKAFSDLLPGLNLTRTTKGDTTRHFVRVLKANRAYLRDLLQSGELVQRGLVDPVQLTSDLGRPEGPALFRLLSALVAESWIARIKALPAPFAA